MAEHNIGPPDLKRRRPTEDDDSPDPVSTKKRKLQEHHNPYSEPLITRKTPPFDLKGDLSVYIQYAETSTFRDCTSECSIFSRTPGYFTTPCLRRGKPNRILVHADCFNPPHLGHLELLLHIFLRTDEKTIAAMIVPLGDTRSGQDETAIKGKPFGLHRRNT
jgi:hypothetical protein